MPTVQYCQLSDVQNILSAAGVALRVDDAPADANDSIDEASDDVEWYCLLLYTSASLAASSWVIHKCADLAAEYYCLRRGNLAPGGIAIRAQRAREMFEKVQTGTMMGRIPGLAQREAGVPVMSNVRPILRPYPRTVVEAGGPRRSTGTVTQYTQNRDPAEQYNYDFVI